MMISHPMVHAFASTLYAALAPASKDGMPSGLVLVPFGLAGFRRPLSHLSSELFMCRLWSIGFHTVAICTNCTTIWAITNKRIYINNWVN